MHRDPLCAVGCLLLAACLGPGRALGATQQDAVFAYQLDYFQRLLSLTAAYESVVELAESQVRELNSTAATPLPDRRVFIRSTFCCELGKYRLDREFQDFATGLPGMQIDAFNGRMFQQRMSRKLLVLSRQGTPTFGRSVNPFTAVFQFALEGLEPVEWRFDKLREKNLWEALATRVQAVEPEQRLGHECVRINFLPQQGCSGPVAYSVLFAKDLEFFPIFSAKTEGTVVSELSVRELEGFRDGERAIYVPVEVEIATRDARGDVLSSGTISVKKGTLKVNEDIDDGVFTLAITDEDDVWDHDLGDWVRQGGKFPSEKLREALTGIIEQDFGQEKLSGTPPEHVGSVALVEKRNRQPETNPRWAVALLAGFVVAAVGIAGGLWLRSRYAGPRQSRG